MITAFIPIIPSQPQPLGPDEYKDLKVALKLLSGYECERDAAQAQLILLRLSESHDAIIASDTARLVKAGAKNGWFKDSPPRMYELEKIAERSLARGARRPEQQKQMLAVMVGLALLVAGLVAFFILQSGNEESVPWVILGILAALLGGLVAFKLNRIRQ